MDAETISHVKAAAEFLDCCGDDYHPRKRREAIRAMLAEHDKLREALVEALGLNQSVQAWSGYAAAIAAFDKQKAILEAAVFKR